MRMARVSSRWSGGRRETGECYMQVIVVLEFPGLEPGIFSWIITSGE